HCFFLAIVDRGQPEDLDRYRRTFGPLAGDVEMYRLEALALEHRGQFHSAHEAWKSLIECIDDSQEWPGEVGRRAKALVWAHMGENAVHQEVDLDAPRSPFDPGFLDRPEPFKPSAEECFRRSIELAPDRLAGYLALFGFHLDKGQTTKARKVGEQLV